ncbi:cystinosin homolog [Uranotaenia lowii]|uniref:cystinosin homolog n=1 Tax=Uranotaenia lowii TaxID=190385 RepID=UPI002478A0D6|nr:cystinosin homolog [Uranotaenia lowii]
MEVVAIILGLISTVIANAVSDAPLRLWFDQQDFTITLKSHLNLSLWVEGSTDKNVSIQFLASEQSCLEVVPNGVDIRENRSIEKELVSVSVTGNCPGRYILKGSVKPKDAVNDDRLFVRLKVALNKPLIYISLLIGWTYTACWSSGYYPQIWLNYRKKSVVGLSFDFLHINIEYFRRHPYGLNPVIGNDVGFAVHACFATGLTILQCYIYENGGNTVSNTAKTIIGTYFVIIGVTLWVALFGSFHWLDFLYVLSYIKLSTTLVKYFPQAFINYRRKSTEGFSIMNRLLDIAGGLFGILQMVINAWNFGDWHSILGDPVKFGLGLFSILFDLVFIVQHYILYRKPRKPKVSETVTFLYHDSGTK